MKVVFRHRLASWIWLYQQSGKKPDRELLPQLFFVFKGGRFCCIWPFLIALFAKSSLLFLRTCLLISQNFDPSLCNVCFRFTWDVYLGPRAYLVGCQADIQSHRFFRTKAKKTARFASNSRTSYFKMSSSRPLLSAHVFHTWTHVLFIVFSASWSCNFVARYLQKSVRLFFLKRQKNVNTSLSSHSNRVISILFCWNTLKYHNYVRIVLSSANQMSQISEPISL